MRVYSWMTIELPAPQEVAHSMHLNTTASQADFPERSQGLPAHWVVFYYDRSHSTQLSHAPLVCKVLVLGSHCSELGVLKTSNQHLNRYQRATFSHGLTRDFRYRRRWQQQQQQRQQSINQSIIYGSNEDAVLPKKLSKKHSLRESFSSDHRSCS